MKHNLLLTIASLLSILFTSFHHADDVARGMAPGGLSNLIPVLFLLVWLYATLALAGRRSGYVIMLLGGLFGAAMPILHMTGSGYGAIAKSSGGFFFVWTLLAVGVTGTFCVILSARALWILRLGKAR